MVIECELCDAKYNVADSKIPEGGTRMRCKKCGTIISIRKEIEKKEIDAAPASEVQSEVVNKARGAASALSEKALQFGKKAKEKANGLKETAAAKSFIGKSKSDTQEGSGLNEKVNRFLFFSFKIGKYISAFCIVAFILIFLGSIIYYFLGFGDSFERPRFKTYASYLGETDTNKKPDFSNIDERKKVEDKYGDDIKKIVEYGFSEKAYDILLSRLVKYPAKYRKAYINGLDDFLSDGLRYKKKSKDNNIDIVKLINTYNDAFDEEISAAKRAEALDAGKKWYVLGAMAVSMFLYILFLVIPILIKIEENTRNIESANTSGMDLAAAQGESVDSPVRWQTSAPEDSTSVTA